MAATATGIPSAPQAVPASAMDRPTPPPPSFVSLDLPRTHTEEERFSVDDRSTRAHRRVSVEAVRAEAHLRFSMEATAKTAAAPAAVPGLARVTRYVAPARSSSPEMTRRHLCEQDLADIHVVDVVPQRTSIGRELKRISNEVLGVSPSAATTPPPGGPHPWARGRTRCDKITIFLGLMLRSLGVVYGDIGTSVLYTYSTMFPQVPADKNDFVAAASLIIWSLIVLVTLKYVVFVMLAGNQGEGGIFALGGLLIGKSSTLSQRGKMVVKLLMIVGAGLVLGDGAFTPSVSVIGAVSGLTVASADLSNYLIIVTLVILILLFFAQPFGTSKIGILFGPIMLVWFSVLFSTGMYRIVQTPSCLRALNPWEALRYVFHNRDGASGFFSLSSVFLSVTGLEALYADMGHFTAWPVRASWLCIALPALIIQYLGQAALLLSDPTAIRNPFYLTPPAWAFWPHVILATFAAIIASQAIISGSFSLAQQAIGLGFAPPFRVMHTSKRLHGQIFVPFVNFTLLIISLLIVLGFGTSTEINNAYGITVCTMMIITTCLYSVLIHCYWRRSVGLSLLFFASFIGFDGLFWSSVIFKVEHGGWVALLISFAFFVLFFCWWYGQYRLSQVTAEMYQGTPVADFMVSRVHVGGTVDSSDEEREAAAVVQKESFSFAQAATGAAHAREGADSHYLTLDLLDGQKIRAACIPTMSVFVSQERSDCTPQSFEMFLELMHSVPDVIVFFQIVPILEPASEPIQVIDHGNRVFTIVANIGFAASKTKIMRLLMTATRHGVPSVPQEEITVFTLRHIVKVEHHGWYSWIWRWPLLLFAQMKQMFPESVPGVHLEPHNTVMLGMICPM